MSQAYEKAWTIVLRFVSLTILFLSALLLDLIPLWLVSARFLYSYYGFRVSGHSNLYFLSTIEKGITYLYIRDVSTVYATLKDKHIL